MELVAIADASEALNGVTGGDGVLPLYGYVESSSSSGAALIYG